MNPAFPLMMQHAVMYLVTQPYERPVELPAPLVLPIVAESATVNEADGTLVPSAKQTDAGQSTLQMTVNARARFVTP